MNISQIQKILVIDDESSIQQLLKMTLESNGFVVEVAKTAAEAFQKIASNVDFSVILLDLGLPDTNGLAVLSKFRQSGVKIPIIVLTVLDDDQNKVLALDLGADDYVTKPFSLPELLARIRVATRHLNTKNMENSLIRTGVLEIDIASHLVRIAEKELKLTPIEFQILTLLGRNLGKVVTHRVFLETIWGPNAIEHVQYLRVHLGQLRKKLKEHGAENLLVTESGVGYRLLAE